MVEFRIGEDSLELEEGTSISFGWENNALKLNSYSFGRSVGFSIPKTPKNEWILRYESDIRFGGYFSRTETPCEMLYSGGVIKGKLLLSSCAGGKYSACFIFDENNLKGFLESKIAEYVTEYSVQAVMGSVKGYYSPYGFLTYFSKQNGLAGLIETDAPEVKMLFSVNCRFIMEHLRLNYSPTPMPMPILENLRYDYLLCGKMKPLQESTYTGVFGGENIPEPLLPYISITDETGSGIYTWKTKGIFNRIIGKSVALKRCFVAKSDISIKFNEMLPYGMLLVERENRWWMFGTCSDGKDRYLYFQYEEGVLKYYVYMEAGQEFAIKAGERFIIANGSGFDLETNKSDYWEMPYDALGHYILTTDGMEGYDMQSHNEANVTFSFSANEKLEYGEFVNVGGSLPELTVYQFLNTFLLTNGYVPIFSNPTGDGLSTLECWDWSKDMKTAIVLDDYLISINKIERKFDPIKSSNNFKFGGRIEASYASTNITLGDFDIIDSKLVPAELDDAFNDYEDEKLSSSTFIGYHDGLGDITMSRKKIRINQNLKKIIENSTMIEVAVNYPLFRSLKLREKQVFVLRGQTYFCLSANFTEKQATMQLIMC